MHRFEYLDVYKTHHIKVLRTTRLEQEQPSIRMINKHRKRNHLACLVRRVRVARAAGVSTLQEPIRYLSIPAPSGVIRRMGGGHRPSLVATQNPQVQEMHLCAWGAVERGDRCGGEQILPVGHFGQCGQIRKWYE